MGTYQLRPGVFQITTQGTSNASLAVMGSSSEPFNKTFHSYITVEAQDAGISTFNGRLQVNEDLIISGSLYINNNITISGSSTINFTDETTIILVNTSTGAVTLTLPTSTQAGKRLFLIKKIGGTNTLTIDPSGTTPIDGATTKATTDASASIQLWSSGNSTTGYYIMSAYGTWT